MIMPNDFFAKRLASMEEQKERRLAAIAEEKAAQAQVNRLNQQIPLILDCIEKMGLAGLSEIEIAALFRHAADELGRIRGKRCGHRSPSTAKNDEIAPLIASPELAGFENALVLGPKGRLSDVPSGSINAISIALRVTPGALVV